MIKFKDESLAFTEFKNALQRYAHQVYQQPDESINDCLQNNGIAKRLTKEEAWKGFKRKAETPEKYVPHAIITSAISTPLMTSTHLSDMLTNPGQN